MDFCKFPGDFFGFPQKFSRGDGIFSPSEFVNDYPL